MQGLILSKRVEELFENPIKIKDSNSLLIIHHYLFQDVYEWAGKVRTVNISKNGKPFFDGERFYIAFQYIDTLIAEYRAIRKTNKQELAHKLAEILDNANYLHPFREGNGRTQREFLRLLALEKDIKLNLNPPDNKSVYERFFRDKNVGVKLPGMTRLALSVNGALFNFENYELVCIFALNL